MVRDTARAIPRIVIVLVAAAALVITLAGIRAAADIIGPLVLALVLTITVQPLRARLRDVGLPEWATSVLMVVVVYLVLLALLWSLVLSIGQLAALVPTYAVELEANLRELGAWLEARGVGDDQVRAMLSALDFGRVLSVATGLFSAAVAILGDLFFLVTLLLFMVFDTTGTQRALAQVRERRPYLVDALRSFARGTRSYMGVSAGFGLIVAVIDGVALWLLGIPGAFVWAVLAFVTNFIPNIGFVIGVVPPALIALLEGGFGLMLAVVALYSVINVVIQSVIQPRYVGDAVGLSPTITLLSLVFWAWAIGALGALLAVPLTLLMRSLLVEADPDAEWALPLISGKAASGP